MSESTKPQQAEVVTPFKQKVPEHQQSFVTEGAKVLAGRLKSFIARGKDGADAGLQLLAQEHTGISQIDLGINPNIVQQSPNEQAAFNQTRREKVVQKIKKTASPNNAIAVATAAAGVAAMKLGIPEMGTGAVYAGMAAAGAEQARKKGRGVKGIVVGAAAGAASVPLIQKGMHMAPIDHNTGNAIAGSLDDIKNGGAIVGAAVGAIKKRV